MAVITLAEYKVLANITSTAQDARITAIIPLVQDDIIAMCNYDFGAGTVDEAFPDAMQLYAAQMITFQLSAQSGAGIKKSESIGGDYSYSLADLGEWGYPKSIENGLKMKWCHASFKSPRPTTQFRDRRQQSMRGLAEGAPAIYDEPGIIIDEEDT